MTGDNYTIQRTGQHAVITLPAEIDAVNADQIRQALEAALGQHAPVLIINMSQTTFCDSAGVNAIIDTYNQATAAATQLRLVAPGVMRILTLVGVDQLAPIYPTLEDALAETAAAQHRPQHPDQEPAQAPANGEPPTEPPPAEE